MKLKFPTPSKVSAAFVRNLNACYERTKEAIFGSQIGGVPVQGGLGTNQQAGPGTLVPFPSYQNFPPFGTQQTQMNSVLGSYLINYRIGVDAAGSSFYNAGLDSVLLGNLQSARVSVPVEPPVRVDPVFTELAVGMYSLAVGYHGSHNCRLADDPLVDRLPLLLAEKLFKLSQLLNGRCLFSTEGRKLIESILDVTNTGSYQKSADCNQQ